MIDNISDKIKNAIDATGGGAIASRKTGIILAGLVEEDQVEAELKAIEDEEAKDREESAFQRAGEGDTE